MGARIVIWDVQHGSAAYIRTPSGKHIVIDLGIGSFKNPVDATFSPLYHLRYSYNITQLDTLVITHPHRDHLDDIGRLSLLTPKTLIVPWHLTEDQIWGGNQYTNDPIIKEYLRLVAWYSNPLVHETSPYNDQFTGFSFRTFTPSTYEGNNLNNHSVVTVIDYAGSKILIPGDNESPSWKVLLSQPTFVSAIQGTDIYVAAHHGREAGYSEELFEHISPSLVVVSDMTNPGTSVASTYSAKATGWSVRRRSTGLPEDRSCLTTRSDDYIVIDMYEQNGRRYRDVSVD